MNEMDIHKKLKLLRKERGLTLSNLADKIGSDYQQMSRLERGKAKLTIDILMKIAKALDTPIHAIVDLKTDQPEEKEVCTQPHSNSSEELLKTILEEIEHLSDQVNTKLSPHVKATLASKIYNQARQLAETGASPSSIDSLIKFSMGLINSVLSQPS